MFFKIQKQIKDLPLEHKKGDEGIIDFEFQQQQEQEKKKNICLSCGLQKKEEGDNDSDSENLETRSDEDVHLSDPTISISFNSMNKKNNEIRLKQIRNMSRFLNPRIAKIIHDSRKFGDYDLINNQKY